MGQYYKPTLIDGGGEMKTFHSHQYDNGLKLMEHSWVGNNFVNAVFSTLRNNPHKVAWIGDYSDDFVGDESYENLPDDEKEPFTQKMLPDAFAAIHSKVWNGGENETDVPPENFDDLESVFTKNTKGMYLVNHTQHVALDLEAYIKRSITKHGWCVNPLPLLTACGNGRGGGDYYSEVGLADVGSWAFDFIEYTDTVPSGYSIDTDTVFSEGY